MAGECEGLRKCYIFMTNADPAPCAILFARGLVGSVYLIYLHCRDHAAGYYLGFY